MKLMRWPVVVISLLAGGSVPLAWADCTISPKTVPTLTVKAFGNTTVGTFKKFKGTCKFNLDNLDDTAYKITLDTPTVDAGVKSSLLKSEPFLNTDKYPALTFSSTRSVKTGPNTLKLYGNLTIKNTTQPVILDVTISPKSTAGQSLFTATTTIDRRKWGIDAMPGVVSNDVVVKVYGVMDTQ